MWFGCFFIAKNELVASGFQVLHLSVCAGGPGYNSVVLNPDPKSINTFLFPPFPEQLCHVSVKKFPCRHKKNRFFWDFDVLV